MKCDMELPCRLCRLAKRDNECLLNPPNPPSEEEKTRIARRRGRKLRQRDADADANAKRKRKLATSRAPPIPAFAATNGVLLPLTSPSNPLVLSNGSSPLLLATLSSDGDVQASMHDAATAAAAPNASLVTVRTYTGINIHGFAFLKEYANECKAIPISVKPAVMSRWRQLVNTTPNHDIVRWMQRYGIYDLAGIHEVVDVASVTNAAYSMRARLNSDVMYAAFDKHLLQCMALACVIIAEGAAIDGALLQAHQWLVLARDLRNSTAPFVLVGDCIFLTLWIVQCKTPHMVLSSLADYLVLFEQYMATILLAHGFVDQIHRANVLVPDDVFIACARVWLLVKILETEVSVLQPSNSYQYKWAALQDTVVPDSQVIKLLYGVDFIGPLDDFLAFNIAIVALSYYFRRFENAILPRDVIYQYLTLYSDFCTKLQPAADRLTNVMALQLDIAALDQCGEWIGATSMCMFLLVRWLSIVRADGPHFPSLRFAHYLSTLMVINNVMHDIDDRLVLGPGVLVEAVLRGSQAVGIIHLYHAVGHQALFSAAMTCFILRDTRAFALDLAYVRNVISKSVARSMTKIRLSPPFINTPAVSLLVQAVDVLITIAEDLTLANALAADFTTALRSLMPTHVWNAFVLDLFGTEENYDNHMGQLWRLGEFVTKNGSAPIPITSTLYLSTDFLRQYELAYFPFWYTQDVVDGYMTDVVDAQCTA